MEDGIPGGDGHPNKQDPLEQMDYGAGKHIAPGGDIVIPVDPGGKDGQNGDDGQRGVHPLGIVAVDDVALGVKHRLHLGLIALHERQLVLDLEGLAQHIDGLLGGGVVHLNVPEINGFGEIVVDILHLLEKLHRLVHRL